MGGFGHFRIGHEIARPRILADGRKVYATPTGRTFTVTKLSP